MSKKEHFGEIVESSQQSWHIQCWQWDQPPRFGSLISITTKTEKLFGIITALHTGSSDPTRTVHAYQKTEEELKKELPHIFSFLQTTCTALPIGYTEQDQVRYQAPLVPPKLHSFVSHADHETCAHVLGSTTYLAPLMHNTTLDQGTLQEVLLAILMHQKSQKILKKQSLETFIRTYTQYMHHDYTKVRLFLQRVQPLVDSL